MSSQTDGLRRFMRQRSADPWQPEDSPVVVIGAGKGGAGGSVVTALLGIACAAEGRRTLLIDGDEQVGTLHRLFGLEAPFGLDAIRAGSVAPIDAISPVLESLFLLPGGCGSLPAPVSLSFSERRAFFRRTAAIYTEFDLVLVDAGSRLDGVVAAAWPAVNRFLTVSGIDPVSLAASYALIKTLEARWPSVPIDVLFNRQAEARGRDAFQHVQTAVERFLGRDVDYAGTIPEDTTLGTELLAGQPLRESSQGSAAGRAVQAVVSRLLTEFEPGPRRQTFPQLLSRR